MSNTSIHAGIRQKFTVCPSFPCNDGTLLIKYKPQGPEFLKHDEEVGFQIIAADDIDEIGVEGIIKVIRKRVGDGPVYLTSASIFHFPLSLPHLCLDLILILSVSPIDILSGKA
jgi:Arginase family